MTTLLTPDHAWKLFGIAGLILVLLYWLKPRALRIVVPSISLWRQHLGRRRNPRWRERLALLLQLITAALILRALVQEDPPAPIVNESVPVVAVVDGSGSMRAQGRLAAAAEHARALGGGLVLAGEQVLFLAQPDSGELERGLAQLRAGVGDVNLAAAVAAVRAQGHRPIVLGDQDLPGLMVVGPPARDVAVEEITATTSTGLPPQLQVAVHLTNHGDEPAPFTLALRAEGERIGARKLTLAPGASDVARFTLDPLDARWVEARLVDHTDDLTENDVSYALLPALRPPHVELVGPGNRFLEQVLAAMPGVQVRRSKPGSWRLPRKAVDLVIFDRCGPIRTLDLPSVYVDPPEGLGPWPQGPPIVDPVFQRWDYGHPILQGVSLRHLTVETAHPLQIDDEARVLAATAEGPIVAVRDAFPRQLVIGFDLTHSDLPLSVAFPQLIYNMLLWARSDAVGEPTLRARTTTEGVPLAGPGQVTVTSLSGEGTWTPPVGMPHLGELEPGIYEVTTEQGSELVAVYWDPGEHGRGTSGGRPQTTALTPDPTSDGEDPERPYWLLLAFGVLFVEFGVAPR